MPTSHADAGMRTRFHAAPPFATSLFVAALGVGAIETVVVHLLVASHDRRAAWVVTALSLYAVLWLTGYQRSAGQRVSVVGPDALVLRIGLRCEATVPWANVAAVRLLSWRALPAPAPGYLDAAKPGEPNVLLELREPVRVSGPYGIPRTATRLGVRLQTPEAFVARVTERLLSV